MDPIEIQNVPDSPDKQLEVRIREGARALRAKLPEQDD